MVAAALAVGLSACSASEAVEPKSIAVAGQSATDYPLTLDNCGTEVTIDAAPHRVVSLDQNSTEILLSLGFEDRIVRSASCTDPVLDSLADANADVPRLADNAPTYEVVLGVDPDFVTASSGGHFNEGGVAPRERFAETGVASYLSPTDCDNATSINGGGTRTTPLTIDALYQEITSVVQYAAATSFVTVLGSTPTSGLHAKYFPEACVTRITNCTHNLAALGATPVEGRDLSAGSLDPPLSVALRHDAAAPADEAP